MYCISGEIKCRRFEIALNLYHGLSFFIISLAFYYLQYFHNKSLLYSIEFDRQRYTVTDTDTDMHRCLVFLPILGNCSIPIPITNTLQGYGIILIPIPNTQYVTDSYRFFTDITLKNRLISLIPISPIPIPSLGDCFIQIQIPIHTDSFYTDTETGYRYRYKKNLV